MTAAIDFRLWAVLVLVFSIGIFWACLCRLNAGGTNILKRVRMKHSVLLGGTVAVGLQPLLFGDWPGPGTAIFASAVFIYLLAGVHRWKGGPPADLTTSPVELNPK